MKITQGLAEGQVLQRLGRRGATARLGGECAETGPVFATISAKRGTLKGWTRRRVGLARGGRFSALLAGVPAGGPYRLELRCGGAKARVAEFFCGDVWLMAGQSNMEGVGDMDGVAEPHPLVRVFSLARVWRRAEDPLHVLPESPDLCHSDGNQLTAARAEQVRRTAVKGVGVGVFFGREMLVRSGVPQGLIAAAHGGTSMDQWSPALRERGGDSLYGSMLLSLRAAGQPIAGVLWYQGESDANDEGAQVYAKKMRALVAAIRRDLRQPGLPWLMVQIGGVAAGWGGPAWNRIQDEQRLLALRIKNLETVAAIDLPLDDNIHIGSAGFPRLAARLARAADRLAYGNRSEAPMPRLRTIAPPQPGRSPSRIEIVFDNVVGGLRSEGEPRGFTILDSEGRPVPCIFKTTLHGDMARLHFQATTPPPENARLSYGHGAMPVCTITDGRGCALPVFGPLPCFRPAAMMPFLTKWRASSVVESPPLPLDRLACPDPEAHAAETRVYEANGFVNEHARWVRRAGHAYFSTRISLPEAMRLEFLFGYDGPFRCWLDGAPLHNALDGTNPCLPDKSAKRAQLPAGEHVLTVAMDLNGGAAWGFFLRMRRVDLSRAQVAAGAYARPVYL